jgi:peptidoglycan/xylan/chitin deacetylase (PgdA/CDA1 family)
LEYIASYDLENIDRCVSAARAVAATHRRRGLPATFFVVGRCLQEHGRELRSILDEPLFEIQSHTFSHGLLRDSKVHGPGVKPDEARYEIEEGLRILKDTFGHPCTGLRTPCGFDGGLRGMAELLAFVRDQGLEYVSSDARGPGDTLPAPLKPPYTYEEDGFPELWELPIHGWHDNVLKGFFPGIAIVAYPPEQSCHFPPRPPESPEEDAAHHILWVDRAAEADLPFVSLAFHPWSLIRFDPKARELDLIFDALSERGVEVVTAGEACRRLSV